MSDNDERTGLFVVLWVIAGLLAILVVVPVALLLVGTSSGQDFLVGVAKGWWLVAVFAVIAGGVAWYFFRMNRRDRAEAMRQYQAAQGDSSNHSDVSGS